VQHVSSFFSEQLNCDVMIICVNNCCSLFVCEGRDDDFERTKKTDFKGEYHGVKEEPVVSTFCPSSSQLGHPRSSCPHTHTHTLFLSWSC